MKADALRAALDAAYAAGTFPCAVVSARSGGSPAFFGSAGSAGSEPAARGPGSAGIARTTGVPGVPGGAPESWIFDLASLSKPLATSLVALRAVEAGVLALDAPLSRYLPDAACSSLGATVREVMAHSAGLPPIPELQRFFPDAASVDRVEATRRLLAIEPDGPPGYGVAYSCTGFLLLGVALERLGGARLSELFKRQVAEPLGLSDGTSPSGSARDAATGAPRAVATFMPSPDLEWLCVPTEECAWRARRVRGEVHDESSYCMGGDGGNAGLFANLAGAEALFEVWESGGGLLKPGTVAAARACATDGLERRRGLGIQLHDGETCDTDAWPADSYGHTGFTGTCAWAAPATADRPRVSVVSLTNRVFRGRAATAELIVAFRKALHGAAARAL